MIDKTAASILPEEEPAPGARIRACALDHLRHALRGHDHQLHGPAGSGASQTHPDAERCQSWHRPDRRELSGRSSRFFTLFYALGQLAAGRFVDKVGTRIGYMVIMALWSLSAMGHALVNSVLQLGIARSCLGMGESGNFPAANKTNAEWFPQKERSLSFGIFNCGANVGVILATLLVPIGNLSLWLALRLSDHRIFLGIVDSAVVPQVPQARRIIPHSPPPSCAYINQDPAGEARPVHALGQVIWLSRRPGPMPSPNSSPIPSGGSISTGCRGTSATNFISACSVSGLPILIVYNASAIGSIYGGYLPASFIRMGLSAARARLAAMLLCACLVVPVFLINYLQADNFGKWAAIGLLSLAAAAHQGLSANLFTTASDMFPRSAVGSVTGIGTMAGAVGGFLFAKLHRSHSATDAWQLFDPLHHRRQRLSRLAAHHGRCLLPD